MRIYPPDLDIGDTEGFTAEKDIFSRAALGEGLANLLGELSDPTVLAIDGPWGVWQVSVSENVGGLAQVPWLSSRLF